MRTYLSDYECLVPNTVDEALNQKAGNPDIIPIAGGTDVMVWMNFGVMPGKVYQSLHRLEKEWKYIQSDSDGNLRIGALATYSDIRHHKRIKDKYPLLVESAKVTGALQIQNRGTLVGNIANGSPAADSLPPLMVYDALILLKSTQGERWVKLPEFFTGYKKNVMKSEELIVEIRIPPVRFKPEEQYFRKVGTRAAQAISKVVFAGAMNRDGVRLAWGSVAPMTLRSLRTEKALEEGASFEEAWQMLQREINPIDDIRSTREYRLKVCRNILFDFIKKIGYKQ